jgi:hypothetical protein
MGFVGPDVDTIATNIKAAWDIARVLANTDQTFSKAELKLKLADLMIALSDARADLADVKSQTQIMQEDIANLTKKPAFAGAMGFEAPYYWNTADGKRDGPYCATCWEGHAKLAIHLFEEAPGHWRCNTCGKNVFDSNWRR